MGLKVIVGHHVVRIYNMVTSTSITVSMCVCLLLLPHRTPVWRRLLSPPGTQPRCSWQTPPPTSRSVESSSPPADVINISHTEVKMTCAISAVHYCLLLLHIDRAMV
jgi:hypothetical protein